MSTLPQLTCIGLTGGIGCGKSTVARLFEALGTAIIDTDAIAHQLTQAHGIAIPLISERFGNDYLTPNGALDRSKMRHLIYNDVKSKAKLEAILHPLILTQCMEQLERQHHAPYAILMAPLLLENPAFLRLVQRVLLIDCTIQNQISRVSQRSGLVEAEIRAIIASQMPQTERIARAHDIIRNDGTLDDLTNQVAGLHQLYLSINNNHLTAC
jgi:dephospho-CoA kinase